MKSLSHVRLFATPWTVVCQTPPSMGFSRQEYYSGLPFPSPGDLPNPGIEPRSPALWADAFTLWAIREVQKNTPNVRINAGWHSVSMTSHNREWWALWKIGEHRSCLKGQPPLYSQTSGSCETLLLLSVNPSKQNTMWVQTRESTLGTGRARGAAWLQLLFGQRMEDLQVPGEPRLFLHHPHSPLWDCVFPLPLCRV